MSDRKRIDYLDVARAMSMLWIIGVWHFHTLINGFPTLNRPIFSCITTTALAAFSFISGFFMNYQIRSLNDALSFYYRRLKRFYPLYFLACCSMFAAHLISGNPDMMNGRQFILSLFGLSTLVGPSPITLWYMAMIMLFYIITPILNKTESIPQYLITALFIEFVFYIGTLTIRTDERMLVYFPVYILGLFFGKFWPSVVIQPQLKKYSGGGILALSWLLYIGSIVLWMFVEKDILFQTFIGISSIVPVFSFCWTISKGVIKQIAGFISTASLVAYLFHSQYYWCVVLLIGKINIVLAYFVILPAFIVGCYYVQKAYSVLMIKFSKTRV